MDTPKRNGRPYTEKKRGNARLYRSLYYMPLHRPHTIEVMVLIHAILIFDINVPVEVKLVGHFGQIASLSVKVCKVGAVVVNVSAAGLNVHDS